MEPGHPVASHRDLFCQDYLLVVPQANQMHIYPFGADGVAEYFQGACAYCARLLDVLRLAARVEALKVPMLPEKLEQLGYAFLRQHLQGGQGVQNVSPVENASSASDEQKDAETEERSDEGSADAPARRAVRVQERQLDKYLSALKTAEDTVVVQCATLFGVLRQLEADLSSAAELLGANRLFDATGGRELVSAMLTNLDRRLRTVVLEQGAGTHADAFSAGVLGPDGLCAPGNRGIRFEELQFYAFERVSLQRVHTDRKSSPLGENGSENATDS